MLLPACEGTWTGTNGFRLMPTDPLAEFPARVTVTTAAGPQDGLVLIGATDEDSSLVAMWGDSWHQKPAPMMLSGSRSTDAVLELEGEYGGGWRWRVIFDATEADSFRMQMDNVIPAEQATAEESPGPYPVMIMQTQRA
jgi:hypothetical protein